ncbi:thioredoxin family protein [Pseudogracilibacillus auburnensis]|uniref:thioredoxin family protein n=1 Tax=Pseudogracilibacillus auburnensis TaxID=1494959 RepID=UPI001A966E6D|nr:thioredoxin family protein [Pseudogracilibacillus auburnensis]MBO1005015.1 thioredoxin family protein [Pseudogracilibacillus auburnensis]
MSLNEWFERGISKEEYIDSLQKHRDNFLHIYENFSVPTSDSLSNKENIRTIVLAEEWCGHCMLNIPILLRLTEQANIPIRFLPRDENLELMDQYTVDGKRYIPIVIFIDQEGNEVAKWGPMAPEVKELVEKLKVNVPTKDSPDYEEAFRQYVKEIVDVFRHDAAYWNYVYEDMIKSLP